MSGAGSTYGPRRVASRVLVGKPERKSPLGRPTRRRENNIKMDLRKVGCGPISYIRSGAWTWIDLARDKTVGGHL
jgi:hypothetical protein